MMKRQLSRFASSLLYWALLFPLRIIAEIAVTLLDLALSRYLVALATIGVLWAPFHLFFEAGTGYWLWPSLVLGTLLCGLWDGCEIFTVRDSLSRRGLVSPRD